MADTKYKDKTKEKGEGQYSNNRGLDAIASIFGGMVGKAVESKRAHKRKLEKAATREKKKDTKAD